jgi:hypothetical protein
MRYLIFLVILVTSNPAYAEDSSSLKLNPACQGDYCLVYKPEETIKVIVIDQKQYKPTVPDWAWFMAGTLIASVTWGFFYYEKNR